MKRAVFHPKARDIIRGFPKEVRCELGEAITDLQFGHSLQMPISKPMPSVATGVSELRVKDRNGIYRVFYYLKVVNKVLIIHAFQKKTRKTPQDEIELAKKRLKEFTHG